MLTSIMNQIEISKSILIKDVTDNRVSEILQFHFKEHAEEIYNDLKSK